MTTSLQSMIQKATQALATFAQAVGEAFHSGLERLQLACEFAALRIHWRYDPDKGWWTKGDRVIDAGETSYWLRIVLDPPRANRTQHIRFNTLHEAMKAERFMP